MFGPDQMQFVVLISGLSQNAIRPYIETFSLTHLRTFQLSCFHYHIRKSFHEQPLEILHLWIRF